MRYTYDISSFKTEFESGFTWLNGFMRNVRRFGDRTALIDPLADRCWNYRELNADCNRLANALRTHGVGEGDVVLYQLPNSPQFAFCYIAPQKLGAINSPANFNLSPGETAQILERNRPAAYIYDSELAKLACAALTLSAHKPALVLAAYHHGERPLLPEGHLWLDDFMRGAKDTDPEAPAADLYSEVTRLYTSGTTGLPKAIPVNNAAEVLSAHDVCMHFPMNLHDVTMNLTPWFHRGGLHSGGLTPTLYVGGTCVVLRQFNARLCLSYVGKYGVSFLIGVPAILKKLADRQAIDQVDLSGLRGVVAMGSPLDRDSCIRLQNVLTPNIFNGYGTTETFWNCFLRPEDLPRMAGSAGRSCTDDEVRVVRLYEDGRRAEPDDTVPKDGKTQGEIIIHTTGKSTLCYPDNPALTEEKYYRGWLYTHDVGVWDAQSYISVAGRKDDMIICMGENIYPDQIESVLEAHLAVRDSIVVGLPDPGRGEAVAAYIQRRDPALTIQEISAWCVKSPYLSAYKRPRYYCFVDEIPYNASGKKLRHLLRARAQADLAEGKLKRP